MLPLGRRARRTGTLAEAHVSQPRVTPGDPDAAPGGSHERLRLVKPDRHVRPQPPDQPHRHARLRLRRGRGAARRDARQEPGKLRLRSTPRAFQRVLAARPSGFRSGTTQTVPPAGGCVWTSRDATAIPARSFPWIVPKTSTSGRPRPAANARIGRRGAAPDQGRPPTVPGEAHVHVVVVIQWQHLDDGRRSCSPVFGPTNTFSAPARTKRSTRS